MRTDKPTNPRPGTDMTFPIRSPAPHEPRGKLREPEADQCRWSQSGDRRAPRTRQGAVSGTGHGVLKPQLNQLRAGRYSCSGLRGEVIEGSKDVVAPPPDVGPAPGRNPLVASFVSASDSCDH